MEFLCGKEFVREILQYHLVSQCNLPFNNTMLSSNVVDFVLSKVSCLKQPRSFASDHGTLTDSTTKQCQLCYIVI